MGRIVSKLERSKTSLSTIRKHRSATEDGDGSLLMQTPIPPITPPSPSLNIPTSRTGRLGIPPGTSVCVPGAVGVVTDP